MRTTTGIKQLIVVGVGFGAVLAWSLAGRGQEGEAKPSNRKLVETGRAEYYYGVSTCKRCHVEPNKDLPKPVLCQCNEVGYWEWDKHRQAYNALLGDLAKKMNELMPGFKNVADDARCLNCHGISTTDPAKVSTSFHRSEEGVSCVVCHGPDTRWYKDHSSDIPEERTIWRKRSREEKQTKYGMTDLWNPAKRAQLCDSCHIGNTDQGKFITHEMYAAGHPPLPGIEVASFSRNNRASVTPQLAAWLGLGRKQRP